MRRLPTLLALLALGAAPALGAAQRVGVVPPACTPADGTVDEIPAVAAGQRPLAVLAFETTSGEQARHELAAALGSRVSVRLRTVRPREVIARATRGGGIAGAVNGRTGAEARHLLAATLEPGRGTVSLIVRLLEGRTGREVWRGRFARGSDRLFELEGAIAAAVASRTLRDLTREEMLLLTEPPTRDPEAYGHFLAGIDLLDDRDRAALPSAIASLDAAWRADPTFVDAWVRLAGAYARFLGRDGVRDAEASAMLTAGLEAADRALALDARRSDAWVARAVLLEHRSPRELTGVRDAYERALAVDPNDFEAHRRLGRILTYLGENERAAAHLRSALFLEPERARALADLAELRLSQGRFSEACAVLNAAIDAEPSAIDAYILRVLARIPLHEYRAAWADAETAMRLGSPTQGEAASLLVDLAAEETAAARARAGRLRTRSLVTSDRALTLREGQLLAYAFVAVGDRQLALRSLERVQPRGAALWRVMQDPRLIPLRGTRSFQTLLAVASPFEDRP
jgi:Tfp pilus assembly protein PilF/TolB-like protein